MTDELEPTKNGPSADADADTSRVPVPPAPTEPLTPASRTSWTPPTYDHEVAWAATAPAAPVVPTNPPRRRSRLRWAISITVVALVIGATAAVAVLLTGASSTATVLGYVPAGTTMYGEVRLDLPGDQRRAVGEFLSKFPGFKDQAALDSKLDEVLDDLVKGATKDDQSYTANIEPWFDGELAFSMGPLPPAASLSGGDPSAMASFRALALMSIKDPAAAQAWFDAALAKSGAKTTTETYNGATLTRFEESGGVTAAFALIDGKVAVAGDIASVKAAVDTKGSGGFADEAGPKAALDAPSGDYVGFVYVALRPLLDWSSDLTKAIPTTGGMAPMAVSDVMRRAVPDWGAYWLRIEGDAIVMEAVSPKPETVIGPTENRSSAVVEHIPATAILASSSNDFGETLKQGLGLYVSDPSLKPVLDGLDQALGLVGGADAALGWAGDTAFVINDASGTPEAGMIVVPTDKAAAEKLFTSLRAFIALGGGQAGITIKEETHNGVTITIVDLGDLKALTGMTGAAGVLPVPAGSVQIAYAVTDDIVVIGSGPGFVKHVLDTTKATSLAEDESYKKLAGRAGTGTGTTFVDITTIRELIEKAAAGSADAAALTKYEKDIKPFLVPFDAMVASGSVDGDMARSVVYITVQ